MKAMILTAGEGTRLRPLTDRRPKPMLPLAGRPLLYYTLDLLAFHGVQETVLNLYHAADTFEAALRAEAYPNLSLYLSHEPELLGTAGAVRHAAHRFDATFVLLYGDNLVDIDLADLIAFHRESNAVATIGLFAARDASKVGVVQTDEAGRVVGFVEKPGAEEAGRLLTSPTRPTDADLTPLAPLPYSVRSAHREGGNASWDRSPCSPFPRREGGWGVRSSHPPRIPANAGIYVLDPEVLDFIPRDRPSDWGYDVFPALLQARKRVMARFVQGHLRDTGTPTGFLRAHRDLLHGRLPRLWRPESLGLRRLAPRVWAEPTARVATESSLRGPALLLSGVVLEGGARVGFGSVLGAGVRVEAGSCIVGSVIGRESRLGRDAVVDRAIVGEGCRLEPGCYINQGVIIGDNTVIRAGAVIAPGTRVPAGAIWP